MLLRHFVTFTLIALLAGCAGIGSREPCRATATRSSGVPTNSS